ncbi:MAG: ribonuclease Z [Candidatus Methanoperedens sp.]|nr:ribonuclease Z [Candidatus Methanoperedens sp.]
MKVVFLGTNGWYDTETGNTVCTLIETKDYFIILDAGNGIYKLDRYITNASNKPIKLFISHFHIDHISGMHILNKFRFNQGMKIYGQAGTKDILNRIVNSPYTIPFSRLPFKVDFDDLSEGTHHLPFSVECRFLHHSSPCMGYRFELEGKIITYCPDTGVCENAIKLSRNADLLITECSFKSGQSNAQWPHLNPEDAAQIANEAKVRKLVLIHFDTNIYRTLKERKEAETIAKNIFQNTFAAIDNMQIQV